MTTLKTQRTTSYVAVFLVLCASVSFLLHEIVLYSTNTISVHPEWVITGRYLLNQPPFGDEGENSRVPLRQNRLWLNEWHGFNEYLLNKIFQPGVIRFRFSVAKNSYFYVIFNKTANGFSGIRISRSSAFPSIHFAADREGKFLSKQPLGAMHFTDGWHQAELIFKQGAVRFNSEQGQSYSFTEAARPMQLIGFRASRGAAMIDDVHVIDGSGKLVIHENFRNHQIDWPLLIVCAVLSGLIALLIFRQPNTLKKACLLIVAACITLSMYYLFDYYYWSSEYHFITDKEWKRTSGLPYGTVEKARLFAFQHLSSADVVSEGSPHLASISQFLRTETDLPVLPFIAVIGRPSATNYYDHLKDDKVTVQRYMNQEFPSGYRTILFLGSSQMFGSGATYPKDRIAFHIWENLVRAGVGHTMVVNGSEHGTNSHELLKRCKDRLYLFRPSIVLINLSTNDATAQFHEGLEGLLDWTKAIQSKVIFIKEANTIEIQRAALLKKHGIMAEIATEAKAPLFGLNEFMSRNEIYDSGILWWDPVHMTSYGQRIAAGYLSQKLMDTGFLNAATQ